MESSAFDETALFRSIQESGARALPTIDDLILTKQINPRPKDIEDVRLLLALKGDDEA